MKDQYFGDFGDYQKFSLLKIFRDIGGLNIVVHWMKTTDDQSSHGSRIKYLEDPSAWESFDPGIFNFIKRNVAIRRRELSVYETSEHARGIGFIGDNIENVAKRSEIIGAIGNGTFDLLFFDPDNGIETQSVNTQTQHKYVTWAEIEAAFGANKSVLVYQHYSRRKRDDFTRAKLVEFGQRFSTPIFAIRVKHSVYFLLTQKRHLPRVRSSLATYCDIWGPHVMVEDASLT